MYISCIGILLANRVLYCYKEIKHFSPLDDSECWFLAGYIPTINHFERMIVAQCILHHKSTPKNNDAQSAIITHSTPIYSSSIVRYLERHWSRRRIGLLKIKVLTCTFWDRENFKWIKFEFYDEHVLFTNWDIFISFFFSFLFIVINNFG